MHFKLKIPSFTNEFHCFSLGNIHKYAKDKYSKRFPELETLVVQPLNYLMTARELGNTGLVNVQANKNLEPFLNQATIMVVSVTASTTQGVEISKEDLDVVSEACDIGKFFTHLAK